jgi:hypothetical protein
MFSYPTWNLERDISTNYPVHLIVALHRVFAKHGYTTFTREVAAEDRENAEGPFQAIKLTSHQIRFVGELRMLLTSLWSENRTREERQGIQEQEKPGIDRASRGLAARSSLRANQRQTAVRIPL